MAHLIMAYKDPAQIERLVKKMSHPQFDFFIHVDTKFDLAPFEYLQNIERVHLIQNRQKVRWAGYSFIKALLGSVKEILESNNAYDFINVMSGQDYPIKSTEFIHDFFKERKGTSFIYAEKDGSPWWQKLKGRVLRYHMIDYDFRGKYRIENWLNALLPKRKFPLPYVFYGGSKATWWVLTAECARYVVDFLERHPKVRRFAKHSLVVDEYLIPTIIMNSDFRDRVELENYRYVEWPEGKFNPRILTVEDFNSLKDSSMLFARKFDIHVDTRILDMLDDLTREKKIS